MDYSDNLDAGLVGGVLLGGAVGWLLGRSADPDEERPPILVKYGSLIFESGNTTRPGKRWKRIGRSGDRWQQDHGRGKKVEWLAVHADVTGGTRVYLTREIRISQQSNAFTLSLTAPGKSSRTALTVTGSGFREDNSAARPTLTHPAATDKTIVRFNAWGETFEVEWENQRFWIWQL